MDFRAMLNNRIAEILEGWPSKDQYAIMFFIYPNESYEYGGYSNLPEFTMLYKCESDMPVSGTEEERWNPPFWQDCDDQQSVIYFEKTNPMADGLIDWYHSINVQDIGDEDAGQMYDRQMRYIGHGPNGLAELLELVVDIARELQMSGFIESKFGKKLPIIIADYEFTWYMVAAKREANPHGEANDYIDACLREGRADETQIKGDWR